MWKRLVLSFDILKAFMLAGIAIILFLATPFIVALGIFLVIFLIVLAIIREAREEEDNED